jgi:hypothetical protein
MSSPSVAIQVHVSSDSRYVLLPVMQQAATVRGWVVYDTVTGNVLDSTEHPGSAFTDMHQARDWVNENLRKVGS